MILLALLNYLIHSLADSALISHTTLTNEAWPELEEAENKAKPVPDSC